MAGVKMVGNFWGIEMDKGKDMEFKCFKTILFC
jgi:hypothetical protein